MQQKDQQLHDKPIVVNLQPGTYNWCSCGQGEQPFCDGSHTEFNAKNDTNFQPIQFEVKEQHKKAICACKNTNTEPYCDGSHAKKS